MRIAVLALIIAIMPTHVGAQPIVAIDGDTVEQAGVVWRLIGIDTPETSYARCEGERRTGILAQRRLEEMIARGSAVSLHGDGKVDKYKRRLGRLTIDGVDASEALIAEGYGRAYNGSVKKGWCSRDSRDDLIPGPAPKRGD